jgi:CheY-like chemotaxis protein|tara:strand:+ start:76 stop:285 length:210 start_codon:yes stop_codon:yes gene_type:complete
MKSTKNKILLIDDEKNDLMMVSEVLENNGYKVDTVANGFSGIELLKKQNYDLIMTNLAMDVVDGITVFK